jgi:hydrogenase nickel incorporation protein HypA/HybF
LHELAIAESLLEIILEESRRHNLQRLHTVRLHVGALAAVVPESLEFCFNLVSQNTIASGVELAITTLPIVARCPDCNTTFEVENQTFLCPACGDPALELISGRELSLVGIEGETGDDDGTG